MRTRPVVPVAERMSVRSLPIVGSIVDVSPSPAAVVNRLIVWVCPLSARVYVKLPAAAPVFSSVRVRLRDSGSWNSS